MKIIIAYGSLGKIFHMKEFSNELEKLNTSITEIERELAGN